MIERGFNETMIATPSGAFDYLAPDFSAWTIYDVANRLSRVIRYAGQWGSYNVLRHSLHVAEIVVDLGGTPMEVLGGLMHDAHEAVTGDVPTPLKRAMRHLCVGLYAKGARGMGSPYDQIEHWCQSEMLKAFAVDEPTVHSDIVKRADRLAYAWEIDFLIGTGTAEERGIASWGTRPRHFESTDYGARLAFAMWFLDLHETIDEKS